MRALERNGWVNVRQTGSHVMFHKDGRPEVVSVPNHSRDLKRGTVAGIVRDAGLSIDEFIELLRT